MSMYFFTFLATPNPEAKEFHDAGGAYVNCWIRENDRERAQESAQGLIQDYGWSVESLEEGAVVTGSDYDADDEYREFYEQALVEGEVLVFNTWPRSNDEDDEDDEDEEEEDEE
jgi:hypothetical protein